MVMSRDLFLSILSMDAYNRGYNPGIAGLSDAAGTQIGGAVIQNVPLPDGAVPASFYGLAYKLTEAVGTSGNLIALGTTIISYRGTQRPVPKIIGQNKAEPLSSTTPAPTGRRVRVALTRRGWLDRRLPRGATRHEPRNIRTVASRTPAQAAVQNPYRIAARR